MNAPFQHDVGAREKLPYLAPNTDSEPSILRARRIRVEQLRTVMDCMQKNGGLALFDRVRNPKNQDEQFAGAA